MQSSMFQPMDRIQRKFEEFHRKNPHIYQAVLRLARQAKDRGRRRIGIGMIFEVLRWNSLITTDAKDYKLSNSLRSRYARKVMDENPELKGIFVLKPLKGER